MCHYKEEALAMRKSRSHANTPRDGVPGGGGGGGGRAVQVESIWPTA
jgi:hypothetical protein